MPSSVGHALAALAIGAVVVPRPISRRVWTVGAATAVLPDIDAIGRPFGYPDIAWLGGHRALTHSILFALVVAALAMLIWFREPQWSAARVRLLVAFAAGMISHGVLDALTTYGGGVAFLAPFTWRRFESSWEPIRGVWSEVIAIWIPSSFILWHGRRRSSA
jgi:inner membrane protein